MNNIITPEEDTEHLERFGGEEYMICLGLRNIYDVCRNKNMKFNMTTRKFINNKGKSLPEYFFIEPIKFYNAGWKYKLHHYIYKFLVKYNLQDSLI
jgi:hypothetical protein